jgi:hypothetical protein
LYYNGFVPCVAQVCGACVFVALFNRLVLPWFTSDYALEQLADALEQAALLFSQIYNSQLERMRLAELVAGQIKQQVWMQVRTFSCWCASTVLALCQHHASIMPAPCQHYEMQHSPERAAVLWLCMCVGCNPC